MFECQDARQIRPLPRSKVFTDKTSLVLESEKVNFLLISDSDSDSDNYSSNTHCCNYMYLRLICLTRTHRLAALDISYVI